MNLQKRQKIESLLQEDVDWQAQGYVENLNLTPPALIQHARFLPKPLSYQYLTHFISRSNRRYIKNFLEDVIDKGKEAKSWRMGRIILPSANELTLRKILEQGNSPILELFDTSPQDQWVIYPPSKRSWQHFQFIRGAPAIARPNVNYKWRCPSGLTTAVWEMRTDFVELSTTPTIAMRRWIASIIARRALQNNLLHTEDALKLVRAIYPSVSQLSIDAETSIQALMLEYHSFGFEGDITPGYIGPEQWYAVTSQ